MPFAAKKPCSKAGCGWLTNERFCDRHQAEARRYDANRMSAARRGYGHRWRKIRERYLGLHPICEQEGCTQAATDVDHIIARKRGGDDGDGNLQALCHPHHSRKTAIEDGGFGHAKKSAAR